MKQEQAHDTAFQMQLQIQLKGAGGGRGREDVLLL